MTTHFISDEASRGKRRRAARVPRDLFILILVLAGAFAAASGLIALQRLAPSSAPIDSSPPPVQAPATPPPQPEGHVGMARARPLPPRAAPPPAEEPASQLEADTDPFVGLDILSAAELDTISQAR